MFMIVYTDLRPGNYVKYFTAAKQKKLLCLTLTHLQKIQSGTLEVWPVDLVANGSRVLVSPAAKSLIITILQKDLSNAKKAVGFL